MNGTTIRDRKQSPARIPRWQVRVRTVEFGWQVVDAQLHRGQGERMFRQWVRLAREGDVEVPVDRVELVEVDAGVLNAYNIRMKWKQGEEVAA